MVRYEEDDTATVRDDRVVRDHTDGVWSDPLARILASLALALALIALMVAWTAYNRTGEDLETRIQRGVDDALNTTVDTTENAGDAIDAGPDGVDEDDTDVPQ